jgi:hypothetical protein
MIIVETLVTLNFPCPTLAANDRTSQTILEQAPVPEFEEEEDPEQSRRRTIAERMAKLGGIKFGAPPPIS